MALAEPVGDEWQEADERAATEHYFLAQNSSNQYQNCKDEEFELNTFDLGSDVTNSQISAMIRFLRQYRDFFSSKN